MSQATGPSVQWYDEQIQSLQQQISERQQDAYQRERIARRTREIMAAPVAQGRTPPTFQQAEQTARDEIEGEIESFTQRMRVYVLDRDRLTPNQPARTGTFTTEQVADYNQAQVDAAVANARVAELQLQQAEAAGDLPAQEQALQVQAAQQNLEAARTKLEQLQNEMRGVVPPQVQRQLDDAHSAAQSALEDARTRRELAGRADQRDEELQGGRVRTGEAQATVAETTAANEPARQQIALTQGQANIEATQAGTQGTRVSTSRAEQLLPGELAIQGQTQEGLALTNEGRQLTNEQLRQTVRGKLATEIEQILGNSSLSPEQQQEAIRGATSLALDEYRTGLTANQRQTNELARDQLAETTRGNNLSAETARRGQVAGAYTQLSNQFMGLAAEAPRGSGEVVGGGFLASLMLLDSILNKVTVGSGQTPGAATPPPGGMPGTPVEMSLPQGFLGEAGAPAGTPTDSLPGDDDIAQDAEPADPMRVLTALAAGPPEDALGRLRDLHRISKRGFLGGMERSGAGIASRATGR